MKLKDVKTGEKFRFPGKRKTYTKRDGLVNIFVRLSQEERIAKRRSHDMFTGCTFYNSSGRILEALATKEVEII